jgi:hypothetical protein
MTSPWVDAVGFLGPGGQKAGSLREWKERKQMQIPPLRNDKRGGVEAKFFVRVKSG